MSKEIQHIFASLPSVDVLLKQLGSDFPQGAAKEAIQKVLTSIRKEVIDG
ncbi:MAG: L-seryl-tRNA(Sec) selenium transferase, partial [Enterococcus sp.]